MNISDRTIQAIQGRVFPFQQAQHAALRYIINYAPILQGSTILSSTWTGNVNIDDQSKIEATTSVMLSGSPGYGFIVNRIVTSSGETEERTIALTILPGGTVLGDYL